MSDKNTIDFFFSCFKGRVSCSRLQRVFRALVFCSFIVTLLWNNYHSYPIMQASCANEDRLDRLKANYGHEKWDAIEKCLGILDEGWQPGKLG